MSGGIKGSQYGSFTFGRSLFGGGEIPDQSPSELPGTEYIIELIQPDGTLVARLPNWYSGQVQEEINVAHMLQFKYPLVEGITENIDVPNMLVLRDLRGSRILQRYIIKSVKDIREEGVDMVLVVGASLISQLSDTIIESYSARTKSLKEIVDEIFEEGQVSSLHFPIVNGMDNDEINTKERRIVSVKNVSIMRVIMTLWDTVGYFLYVTPGGVFKWAKKMPVPSNVTPFIRWGNNLPQLTSTRDYGEVYTKVIVNGSDILGDDTDPDFSGQRISEKITATAQSSEAIIEQFGLKIHPIINDANLNTQALAQKMADEVLERVQSPRRKIDTVAFDLSKAISNLDYDHAQLRLGMELIVIHPKFSTSPTLMIGSRQYDLASSLVQRITLTDPVSANKYYLPNQVGGEGSVDSDDPANILNSLLDLLDELGWKVDELARLVLKYFTDMGPGDTPFAPYNEYDPFWQLLIRKKLSELPTENTYTGVDGDTKRADSAPLLGWAMSQPDAYGAILNKMLAFVAFIFEAEDIDSLPTLGAAPDPSGSSNTLDDGEIFPPKIGYIPGTGYVGLHNDVARPWQPLGGGGFKTYADMIVAQEAVDAEEVVPPQMIYLTESFEGEQYFKLYSPKLIVAWTSFGQTEP